MKIQLEMSDESYHAGGKMLDGHRMFASNLCPEHMIGLVVTVEAGRGVDLDCVLAAMANMQQKLVESWKQEQQAGRN